MNDDSSSFDLIVVGGTPGGIMSAIAAAKFGRTSLILERDLHIGGLPANGLGATDIKTRAATGGLFKKFVNRIRRVYVERYGEDSQQVRDCSDGYHFEPSVAEMVLEQMISEHPQIKVLKRRQFDVSRENLVIRDGKIVSIKVLNRDTRATEVYSAKIFVDATYEGDLAGAASVPFRTRREGRSEYNEEMAGKIYIKWGATPHQGSTGEGDDVIQAYNYRLCLTSNPRNRVPIPKPATYNREEYVSLIDDVKLNRHTGVGAGPQGIAWILNQVRLPNDKTDSNNQHLAFISTDLPEENYPWPTAEWTWRDAFARRLRDYTLGLIYFAQNDLKLPEDFRRECSKWGLAKDEYIDNDHFPRQVYVREGRRVEGEYLFTAHDALPVGKGERPPIHAGSITASHYALDSHAVQKREPGRVHLDGFLNSPTEPYTVPYGVIVPKGIENLLTPVPVSGTHIGFSTLRMEPCWMALGQAAGVAAVLAIENNRSVRKVDVTDLQSRLVNQGAVLIYYSDVKPEHPSFKALQYFGIRGLVPGWEANLDKPAEMNEVRCLFEFSKVSTVEKFQPGKTTLGELLLALYSKIVSVR